MRFLAKIGTVVAVIYATLLLLSAGFVALNESENRAAEKADTLTREVKEYIVQNCAVPPMVMTVTYPEPEMEPVEYQRYDYSDMDFGYSSDNGYYYYAIELDDDYGLFEAVDDPELVALMRDAIDAQIATSDWSRLIPEPVAIAAYIFYLINVAAIADFIESIQGLIA